jgi:hypothetical protein
MTVLSLEPKFTDRKGYHAWRDEWKILYKALSETIRQGKQKTRAAQSAGDNNAPYMQSSLHYDRVTAFKAMTLLDEAKKRMKRIYDMEKQIKAQMETFPISIAHCRTLDFHFNKGSMEFSQLPMWTIKVKGNQYFINHFTADGVPWSTRELPDAKSTKGMLRFKDCSLYIDKDGNATIGTSAKGQPEMLPIAVEEDTSYYEVDKAA